MQATWNKFAIYPVPNVLFKINQLGKVLIFGEYYIDFMLLSCHIGVLE